MKLSYLAYGLAFGLAAMYLYDPDRGRSRRKLLADYGRMKAHRKSEALRVMTRDLNNRLEGLRSEMSGALNHEDFVDDAVLCERVKTDLGRVISHAHAVHVTSETGKVTLLGDILAKEVQDAVRCARGVHGVHSVANELSVHHSAEGIPALQGGMAPNHTLRMNPTACLAMCALGAGMCLRGIVRGGWTGGLMSFMGVSLIGKGFADTEQRFSPIVREAMQPGEGRMHAKLVGRLEAMEESVSVQ